MLTCVADGTRPSEYVDFYQAMLDSCDPCFLPTNLLLGVMLALIRSLWKYLNEII